MNKTVSQVQSERRRLRQVRVRLSDALDLDDKDEVGRHAYYLALGSYMIAAMDRLQAQDIRMESLLRDKVTGTADNAVLQALKTRLERNEQQLAAFKAALETLRTGKAGGLAQFEQAAHAYTDFIKSELGHQGSSTALARRLFSDNDWAQMAAVSEEVTAKEEQLYQAVISSSPATT